MLYIKFSDFNDQPGYYVFYFNGNVVGPFLTEEHAEEYVTAN